MNSDTARGHFHWLPHYIKSDSDYFVLSSILQDSEPTLALRHRRSDAREIQSYYQNYYNDYVKSLDGAEHSDRCDVQFEFRFLVPVVYHCLLERARTSYLFTLSRMLWCSQITIDFPWVVHDWVSVSVIGWFQLEKYLLVQLEAFFSNFWREKSIVFSLHFLLRPDSDWDRRFLFEFWQRCSLQ